jgi:protein gp37
MSDKTGIEWCDATWNPVTGCTKVSEGCRNCYALTFAERWRGTPGHYFETGFDLTLRPDKLDQPLKWKKPRKIFVNSMSDLFHKEVPNDFIAKVFDVMTKAEHHIFMVLTKRPERMKEFMEWYFETNKDPFDENDKPYIAPNIWLGVSVENQQAADERIPSLLQTPAAVRFLSCEPLLGEVDLEYPESSNKAQYCCSGHMCGCQGKPINPPLVYGIDWIIAGGESGHRARPMHPEWARSLRDQCQAAGVSFFFKQWGEWGDFTNTVCKGGSEDKIFTSDGEVLGVGFPKYGGSVSNNWEENGGAWMSKVGKRAAGRLLDGREWNEFPEVRS